MSIRQASQTGFYRQYTAGLIFNDPLPDRLLAAYAAAAFFALYSAQRFLVASIMRFRPAALSRRFLGAGTAFAGFACFPFIAAQRFRCASAIRARTAGLRLRLFPAGGADGAVAAADAADLGGRPRRPVPSPSIDRTCCMCCSKVFFCASNPSSAAFNTSELKLPVCVGMYSLIMPQFVTRQRSSPDFQVVSKVRIICD
jgi:hypothetical protein